MYQRTSACKIMDPFLHDYYTVQTFHHGFPTESTCLEYDAVQQLLAIGTKHGAVLLYPVNFCNRAIYGRVSDIFMDSGLSVLTLSVNQLLPSYIPKLIHTLMFQTLYILLPPLKYASGMNEYL